MIHVCSLAALSRDRQGHRRQPRAHRDGQCRSGAAAGLGAARPTISRCQMDDITEEMDGFVAPIEGHIDAGAELRPRLGPRRAAGGALLCRHQRVPPPAPLPPPACSIRTATRVDDRARKSAPPRRSPPPTGCIVNLADKALGRGGRMVRALDEMGPGNHDRERQAVSARSGLNSSTLHAKCTDRVNYKFSTTAHRLPLSPDAVPGHRLARALLS